MCTRKRAFIVITAVLILVSMPQAVLLIRNYNMIYNLTQICIYAFVSSLIFISTNIIIISHMKQRGNMRSELTNVTLGHGQETAMNREERRHHARSYYCHIYGTCITYINL